jgi:predicted nucleotidyltransferase component of viral defense system
MIKPGEVQQKARAAGVRDQQIEKDYVLSWILAGIAAHTQLSLLLVFKGGTVLKKIYFNNYRYSEDLDFSLNNKATNEQIFEWFDEVFKWVRDQANIPLQIIDNNEHEDGGINFYISYTGPLGGAGANKRVKVDISRSEQLVFSPVKSAAIINYSDLEEYQLLCYTLEEVLVEKMRCVIQRMAARDFYDIWYLLEEHGMEADHLLGEFTQKCKAKDIDAAEFPKKLSGRLSQYRARWKQSLGEQIQNLPDFDEVVRQVQRQIKKIKF